MPDYAWKCRVCESPNDAGLEFCAKCRSPATTSVVDVVERRRKLGLANPIQDPSRLPWFLAPLAYLFIAGPIAQIAAHCGGDMCALIVLPAILLALPWSLVAFTPLTNATAVLAFAVLANTLIIAVKSWNTNHVARK